ncbi:AlkA N-terminal domain-containing protein [Terasakiella sp.]|uniref:AlkA N-terminal domain-containing protein n=1 Tax=Terasakiella sp. TaxID=2034861 RepID=UPI003AA88829
MKLEHDICYQALKSRDARFDGRFFTGVSSTGIFCRPVCPASTPKPENCTFFASASAALQAGFRPCLRCRPESAPASPAWIGTEATVKRALSLIEDGALDEGQSLENLCNRLGVGERHLRRLFQTHLGASPKQIALTRRLMFAKKLLAQTDASVMDIALAAGFNSLRRFNDAYKKIFDFAPSFERKKSKENEKANPCDSFTLHFNYRPPFDWAGLLAFFESRAIDAVEQVTENGYQRRIAMAEQIATVRITHDDQRNRLKAHISGVDVQHLRPLSQKIRRVFDLDADPAIINADLSRQKVLRDLVRTTPGLRVPGAWDGFEIAVRAVIGQQISVKGARTICNRVVERVGKTVFPTPSDIENTDLDGLGLTGRRITTLKKLAASWSALDCTNGVEKLLKDLCDLPGIGPWTAHYIVMRAFGEPDIYPVADLGLVRALEKLDQPAGKKDMEQFFDNLRPWRAYGALHLWKVLT